MNPSNFESFLKSTNVRISDPFFRFMYAILRIGQWVYPRGTANFVRRKFFTPITKPAGKSQMHWIHRATQYNVQSRGKRVSTWKIGDGPTILFVHGWNGRGVQFHHFFQPALDAGYALVFFDAPAHGISEGEMTNYLEVTASLDAIFNHEIGKDIAGVVAHSMGASVIINHLSRYQQNIPLVLIAPALRLMELLFASFEIHGVPKKTYLKLVHEVEDTFQIPLETQNPIDLIYKIKNKILIIHDKDDRITPIGPSQNVTSDLANIELIRTEGYGHTQLLRKDLVISQAIQFIHDQLGNSYITNKEKTMAI